MGTYGDYTHKIEHEKMCLCSKDPAASDFIAIESVTEADVISWIDNALSEAVTFDIEALRFKDHIPGLEESKQPKNQDLTNFRHSTPKEQMQETIRLSIEKQIADASAKAVIVEHTF